MSDNNRPTIQLGPAWMEPGERPVPSTTSFDPSVKLPPAWMTGDQPTPTPIQPAPAPLPPMPPPPPTPPQPAQIPDAPIFIPIPIVPPAPAPTPAPAPKPAPTPAPQPVTPVPRPAITPTVDWRSTVSQALSAVAKDIASSQFQQWAQAPLDIYALILSVSGGDPNAMAQQSFSSKLNRIFYTFGIFQMNEIWCDGYYKDAPNKIGPRLAAKMVPFPQKAPWTKEQAAVPLLDWPYQVLYGMVLLRWFSIYKHTYFGSVGDRLVIPTTTLHDNTELGYARDAAAGINRMAQTLDVSAQFIMLKAYWTGSSPKTVAALTQANDTRIVKATDIWKRERDRLRGAPKPVAAA